VAASKFHKKSDGNGSDAKPTGRFNTLEEAVEAHDDRVAEALLLRSELQDLINRLPSPDAILAACRSASYLTGGSALTARSSRCCLARVKDDFPGKQAEWQWFRRGDYALAAEDGHADADGPPGVLVYSMRVDLTTEVPRDLVAFVGPDDDAGRGTASSQGHTEPELRRREYDSGDRTSAQHGAAGARPTSRHNRRGLTLTSSRDVMHHKPNDHARTRTSRKTSPRRPNSAVSPGPGDIEFFIHCPACLDHAIARRASGTPRSNARLEVGATAYGLQVRCVRHERVVADFRIPRKYLGAPPNCGAC
jgi:hypothetical protein